MFNPWVRKEGPSFPHPFHEGPSPWRGEWQPTCLENSMDRGAWQARVHEFTVHPSSKWYYPRLPCLWMLTACVEVGTQTPSPPLLSLLRLIPTCHPNVPPFSSCCHRPAWLSVSHLANPHSLQAGFHAQIHPPQDICCNASRWTSF